MTFLLDTNVIFETAKPRPEPKVRAWLDAVDEGLVYLSVITLAELRHGIDRLPSGRRRTALHEWLVGDLIDRFDGRVLAINADVADTWAKIVSKREAAGRPISTMDAFVAATAETFDLALVTRNDADFRGSVKTLVNPWK